MEADDLSFDGAESERQEQADRSIADRLDALEFEKVMRRALELESEAGQQEHAISMDQLERIASEIGVDASFVHQALGELHLGTTDRSRLERIVLPEPLAASASIGGMTRAELDDALSRFLVRHEGLVQVHRFEDGAAWDADGRMHRKVAAMRHSGPNRLSKVAGGDVRHRVKSLRRDEHLVTLLSQGEGPIGAAKIALGAGALIALIGIVVSISGGWASFLQGVLLFGGFGAALAAAGVFSARRWGRSITRALGRSLTAFGDKSSGPAWPWLRRKRS